MLLVLVTALTVHLKYLELPGVRVNLYVPCLLILLTVLPIRALFTLWRKPHSKITLGPVLFLLGILVLGLYQGGTGPYNPNWRVLAIFLSGTVLFVVLSQGLRLAGQGLPYCIKVLLFLSVASSIFVILQIKVSPVFDFVPKLAKVGLVTLHHEDVQSQLIERRGRGLGITVGDYAIHNYIPFFFLLLMTLRQRRERRVFYGIALAIVSAGMLASQTSAVHVALATTLGLWFVLDKTCWRQVALVSGGVILSVWSMVTIIMLPSLLDALNLGALSDSIADRFYVWSVAGGMFVDSPVTGMGLGTFPERMSSALPLWQMPHTCDQISAHSIVMDMLSGGGVVGLVLMLGFIAVVYVRSATCVSLSRSLIDKVLFLSWIAYILHAMFQNVHVFALDMYVLGAMIDFRYRRLLLMNPMVEKEEAGALDWR